MSSQITFLLNGERQQLSDVAPSTTLYQLVRARQLTGTKEGCAEGDCGACTVALGALEGGKMRLRAVNSCILLVGQLEGKSVTTVEQVAGPDGTLHPCQQTMVDCHGSQCGFCTPGFIMALYVAHATKAPTADLQAVTDLLAGNLCRCTGYGPIIEAARLMQQMPEPDWLATRFANEAAALAEMAGNGKIDLTSGGQRLLAPTTISELSRIMTAHPDATIVAGATDVGLWITKQFRHLPILVHIGRIAALQQITDDGCVLHLGAGVTYAQAHGKLAQLYPSLGDLISRLGSQLIRNSGTIGGNIANGSPIGDMPPALIALGTTLVLRCGDSQRQMPLEHFFRSYGQQDRRAGEFVEAIKIPLTTAATELKCYKISKRFDQDISTVCGCINIHVAAGYIASARICFGGMAGTPKRATMVEQALIGKPWSLTTITAALTAFDADYEPLSDLRATADYRRLVAKNLLRRYFHERDAAVDDIRLERLKAVTV